MKIYTKSGDDGTSRDFRGTCERKSARIFAALGDLDESNAAIGLALATLTAPASASGAIAGQAPPPGATNNAKGNAKSNVKAGVNGPAHATRMDAPVDADALHPHIKDVQALLRAAQPALFSCGARLAGAKRDQVGSLDEATAELERCIDQLDSQLPPLRTFILPGGSTAAAQLHLARCIVRRAERSLSGLDLTPEDADLQRFINRLSDALFVGARATNAALATPEAPWHASPKPA